MNEKRFLLNRLIIIITAVLILFAGCEKDNKSSGNSKRYREIKNNSTELYFRLHPLRSSRIGIQRADSALFTFSEEELSEAEENITSILDNLSNLTTEGLTEEEIDNSVLILNWLYGERFALNRLSYHKNNPVIYCWMINETLWGIPSRLSPPEDNEMENYRKRLMKIPRLLSTAKETIDKPSQLHTKISRNMVKDILSEFDNLKALVSTRYERGFNELDSTLKYIEDFQKYINEDLSERSYGKMILGLENITKIFDYDEQILSNPNMIIERVEKKTQKLLSSRRSLKIMIDRESEDKKPGESEIPIDKISKSRILEMIGEINKDISFSGAGFSQSPREMPEVIFTDNPGRFAFYIKNPYLSIPYPQKFPVVWIPPPLNSPPPRNGHLLVSMNRLKESADYLPDHLSGESFAVFSIIRALSDKNISSEYLFTGDTLRTLLCSETYRLGLLFNSIDNTLKRYTERNLQMRLHLINARMLDLAGAMTVFKLHSGNYSKKMARDFFMERCGFDKKESTYRVESLLISPAAAYPGITRILLNNINDRLKSSDDIKLRRMGAFEFLKSNPPLPISLLNNKYLN
ncbi:MAG: hypothetical protein U5O15_10225 [Candidatus Krumholzibacteriota bacterium]|nr:hypothetical protein [Candidatus Krumholzibacteriota bacterium]